MVKRNNRCLFCQCVHYILCYRTYIYEQQIESSQTPKSSLVNSFNPPIPTAAANVVPATHTKVSVERALAAASSVNRRHETGHEPIPFPRGHAPPRDAPYVCSWKACGKAVVTAIPATFIHNLERDTSKKFFVDPSLGLGAEITDCVEIDRPSEI